MKKYNIITYRLKPNTKPCDVLETLEALFKKAMEDSCLYDAGVFEMVRYFRCIPQSGILPARRYTIKFVQTSKLEKRNNPSGKLVGDPRGRIRCEGCSQF